MSFAVAIFAHNEQRHVPDLFTDLRGQSAFDETQSRRHVEIYLVANGCTDETLSSAQTIFEKLNFPAWVSFKPVEIAEASKTNAWNIFVHDILPDRAEFVCVLDADIRLPQADLIQRSVDELLTNSDAVIASDISLKDFRGSSPLNIMRFLNRAFERPSDAPVAICGQFYCIRADFLRRIVLPIGLLSQDGFLRAMILTDGLTAPEQIQRISVIPGAFHLHPAYVNFKKMFRFQKRQAIGSALSLLIYKELEKMPADFDRRMEEIRRRNVENPNWVAEIIRMGIGENRQFVPRSYILRMFHTVRQSRRRVNLKWIIVPAAVLYDFVVAKFADAEIRALSVGSVEAHRGKFSIRN